MKALWLALVFAASLRGQLLEVKQVRGEGEYAVSALGKASIQLYGWVDSKGAPCFLHTRLFLVESGSKLAEAGAGCKIKFPHGFSVSLSAAWNTDGYIAHPVVFNGKLGDRQLTAFADHKLKVTSVKPGFTFMKVYYTIWGPVVARWEGTLRDDGTWLSSQPGVEIRQKLGHRVNMFWAFEYDVKNIGPVIRLGTRF